MNNAATQTTESVGCSCCGFGPKAHQKPFASASHAYTSACLGAEWRSPSGFKCGCAACIESRYQAALRGE